jgi:hypothetical protein
MCEDALGTAALVQIIVNEGDSFSQEIDPRRAG